MKKRNFKKHKLAITLLALSASPMAISAPDTNLTLVSGKEAATASSYAWIYTDSYRSYPEMAEFAFDNIAHEYSQDHGLNTYWRPSQQSNEWLMQTLAKPEIVTTYSIQGESNEMYPENWQLQGSQDGQSWITIDEQQDMEFDSRETKTFNIPEDSQSDYSYYRFYFPNNVKPIAITEVKLMSQGDDVELPKDSRIMINKNDDFINVQLSADEYHTWNSQGINGSDHAKNLTKEILSQFNDDFDFIMYVMNNDTRPQGMPFGEFSFVKNDTKGLGLHQFDSSEDFGAQGTLQGIFTLYGSMNKQSILKAMHLDASLHEMFHRWGNWIIKQSYYSHWDNVEGVLTNESEFAPIELYLMGLISSPDGQDKDVWDLDSETVYNMWKDSPEYEEIKPALGNAQTSYRALVVLLTKKDKPLDDVMREKLSANIANFARTDGKHKIYNGGAFSSRNFWHATGGRANINLVDIKDARLNRKE
ncbi:discoidin domain-containing protein [Moritella sp. Urea-trap-13]|uniref:discoidin domain-containing protein n=1 Tax=Moritella sp. Urea-trap-13 TaxID=2058327 RepID=UPI001E4E860E|nr:discoidin domain-containing protein [Moritella sp. Urea-trap-13]